MFLLSKWSQYRLKRYICKRCKYGVHLEQAGSVLCRAYGTFSLWVPWYLSSTGVVPLRYSDTHTHTHTAGGGGGGGGE